MKLVKRRRREEVREGRGKRRGGELRGRRGEEKEERAKRKGEGRGEIHTQLLEGP